MVFTLKGQEWGREVFETPTRVGKPKIVQEPLGVRDSVNPGRLKLRQGK